MDKWQKRMEKVTANAVHRALQNQKRELQKYLDDIGFPSDVEVARIIRHSARPVVDAFISRSQTTIERYYNETGKKWPKPLVGLDWNLPTRPEKIYLEALEGLHLSQNKWSITETTEERVKKLVTSGIKQGHSPQEISKNIENLDPQVFSKNRADLIAINQIGKAKQYGEWVANKEYSDAGYLTLKYWSTVGDNRVTRSHTANQNQGWIHIDKSFSGTGDKIAPASNNPRCRCAIQYEIGNKIGEKQPKDIQQKLIAMENTEKHENFKNLIKMWYNPEHDEQIGMWLDDWNDTPALVELQSIYPFLTKEEIASVYMYVWTAHQPINLMLRRGRINPHFVGAVVNLESMLNALPTYHGTVWRGIDWTKLMWSEVIEKIKNLKEWDVFFDGGFMSTSTKKSTAEDFAKDGILMKIIDAKWHDILDFTDTYENEILLNNWRNLIFQEKRGNIYIFKQL